MQILSKEFQKLINYRLQNIYNVANSSRQFLLKFSVPDSKLMMVVEFGNRIHLTEYERPTEPTPLNFVTKLRKHLKSRRLSNIKQVNSDRVVIMEFSDGLFYLVFEFFSAGNILLLDENQNIMILQRIVNDNDKTDRYAVNEKYTMFDKSLFTEDVVYDKKLFSSDMVKQWILQHKAKLSENGPGPSKSKKNKVFSIHKLLFVNASHLSSDLVLKKLNQVGIKASGSCLEYGDNEEVLITIADALNQCELEYIELINQPETNGVIVSKKNPNIGEDTPEELHYVYDEFHPFKPHKDQEHLYKFDVIPGGYNKTLDTFFSDLESKKNELKVENQKQIALKRLDHAKNERQKQIESLERERDNNIKKGDTIIFHADLVTQCVESVNGLLKQQMDWKNIESYIQLEQSSGNEIANYIQLPLNLVENKIRLKLPDTEVEGEVEGEVDEQADSDDEGVGSSDSESDSESESESESDSDSESESDSDNDSDNGIKVQKKTKAKRSKPEIPGISVWIDLLLSPYANAKLYFDSKKNAQVKQAKVEKNAQMALQNAQKKIDKDLQNALKKESDSLNKIRDRFWFEKFFWFISSDGYLCLSGRDDLQNDMIYYRYFNDNDFFVSSDVEGSLKVFIKNPYKGETVPPSTIWQAGMFSLSASVAWNNKSSNSAWYLPGQEISKKDVDGSILSLGRFNYKGKKQYMPPSQLVMGFGLYFVGNEDVSKRNREKRGLRQEELGLKIVADNKKKDIDVGVLRQELLKQEEKEREGENEGEGEGEEKEEKEEENEEQSQTQSQTHSQSNTLGIEGLTINTQTRGKKSKMKKIAKKYGDQDEEERKMRMNALGTLKQAEKQRQQQAEQEQKNKSGQVEKYQSQAKIARKKKLQDEKELRKYLLEAEEEEEEKREEDEEKNNEGKPLNELDYLSIVDSFVGKPNKEDELESIVPVFAPYFGLQKLKYKVKIQPGNNKKGKSIQEMLHHFTTKKVDHEKEDNEMVWPNEMELLTHINSNDLIGNLPVSKLKIVLPGNAKANSNTNTKDKGKAKGGKGGKKKK